jgi:ribonuclease D
LLHVEQSGGRDGRAGRCLRLDRGGADRPAPSSFVNGRVATESGDVRDIAARAAASPRVALDVESNGLFAYKPALCTVQLAWLAGDEVEIAILDTLATPAKPLEVLEHADTTVVLHDLTFDVRLLREHGVSLGRVRDTSVAARLLGKRALGLASLLESELGLHLDKKLQHHDWASRPLEPAHLAYLRDDVRHLLALDDSLAAQVEKAGIVDEVEEEVRYKLWTALEEVAAPPGYLRVKGLEKLPPHGQAIVRRAFLARERIAEGENVPPFHVAGPELLLELATRRPTSPSDVRSLPAARGRSRRFADDWARAVSEGLSDGALPTADAELLRPPPVDRTEASLRRAREERLRRWRKAEASARGVDEQAILPGHCLTDLARLAPPDEQGLRDVPGVGARRVERYGRALLAALAPASGAPSA